MNVLDIDSKGGALGWMVKERYPQINVLSTSTSDLPSCDYMAEKGQVCILSDLRRSLPFARFSFDLIHMNNVIRNLNISEVLNLGYEMNRFVTSTIIIIIIIIIIMCLTLNNKG